MTLGNKSSFNVSDGEEKEWTKVRILKNLAVVCAGVFFFLSAALPSSELQSSLNFTDGLGSLSVCIGAAFNIIPSALIPPFVIRRFGLKSCMVGAIFIGSLSYFGNYYPRWYTLIPSQILQNMGTSPMWTAKGTYITHIAEKYALLSGVATQTVTNMFFGIFYSTYYCGYIFGNLLPYYLLSREDQVKETDPLCGIDFCDGQSATNNTNFERPSDEKVYLLFGCFAIITVLGAVVVLIFLDSLKVPYTSKDTCSRALDSFRLFKRWDQSCMSIISCYRGLNRALLTADFTKGYITCTWGMNHVGYIMISFGVGCGVMSITLGVLVRWIGRPVLFFLAIASNLGIMLTMIFWKPDPDQYIVFFSLVVIWGASNAVWESQVAALNPILYPEDRDAAYTNYANTENLGQAVGQGISSPVCMGPKVYTNLIVLAAAAVSYIALEVGPLRAAKKASLPEGTNPQPERVQEWIETAVVNRDVYQNPLNPKLEEEQNAKNSKQNADSVYTLQDSAKI